MRATDFSKPAVSEENVKRGQAYDVAILRSDTTILSFLLVFNLSSQAATYRRANLRYLERH
jgi:hypothetical protein